MDPRWELYGPDRNVRDREVASTTERDRRIEAARRRSMSPWEIGRRHWNQRDLYTVSSRTDDAGYALGPSLHPDTGSFAYHRSPPPPPAKPLGARDSFVREAPSAWDRFIGSFFGRSSDEGGVRADGDIEVDVTEALARNAYLDASDVAASVMHGAVTLSGTVPDLESVGRAGEIASRCVGVVDVRNELEVRSDDDDDVAFVMPVLTPL